VTTSRNQDEAASGHRILVAEDDEDLREIIVAALLRADYIVASAADGRQALDLLVSGPTPCLVLSDVIMPAVTGIELREHMLADARLREVPLVVMTAGGLAVEAVLRDLGVTVLRKPLSTHALLDTIAQHRCGPACRTRGRRPRDGRAQLGGSAGGLGA
jgi:CheY-like chemotaxis protein